MSTLANAARWTPGLLSLVRIAIGFLFFQHGAEKLWGFAGARAIGYNFHTMIGVAGPIEVIGGGLLMLGLFTRSAAFIVCGEMAVAYFSRWAPRGFWPITNGGEESAIFCWAFLWLVTAGAGPWSLDALWFKKTSTALESKISSWEPYGRSLVRIILAFTFSLHGCRLLFGLFPVSGARRGIPLALDGLPSAFGTVEIIAGALLFVGLFSQLAALVACCELLAAYLLIALPRAPWPTRNGGNEALIYFFIFLYVAVSGPGAWSLDRLRKRGGVAAASARAAGTS